MNDDLAYSPWDQRLVKVRSNKVKSPYYTKFPFRSMSILLSFASGFQKWHLFWCTTTRNAQNSYFKNIKNFVTALLWNPWAQAQSFFTVRCAVDDLMNVDESSNIKTTGIASVVFPSLFLATFRAILNQCALMIHHTGHWWHMAHRPLMKHHTGRRWYTTQATDNRVEQGCLAAFS